MKSRPNSVIIAVARMIAETNVWVSNWRVAAAHPDYPMSGLQRLRELSMLFRHKYWDDAYEFKDNKYYPYSDFKDFCRNFVRESYK